MLFANNYHICNNLSNIFTKAYLFGQKISSYKNSSIGFLKVFLRSKGGESDLLNKFKRSEGDKSHKSFLI